MQASIDLIGMREATKALREFEGRIQRNVANAANREAMKVWVREAKARVPVRKPSTPGRVVMGSGGRSRRTPGYAKRQIKSKAIKRGKRQGAAHVVHKGAAYYMTYVGKGQGRVKRPNDYMSQAYRRGRQGAIAAWTARARKRIEVEARKVRRTQRG